ncbi:DDB1- and CUL4-associated factor 11 [Chamberlinius hualienensis]
MDTSESESDESSGEEIVSPPFINIEPDLVGLFRSLIRSRAGTRIDLRKWGLGGLCDRADLEEETSSEPEPPLHKINKSELKQETLLMCGEMVKRGYRQPNSVCKMIQKRETGVPGASSFSGANRRFICQKFLPNKGNVIQQYENKVFCGTHSADGSVFVTAGQDSRIRLYNSADNRYNHLQTIDARDVGWSILDTAISPDGRNLVYSTWSECMYLCSVGDLNELHEALPLAPDDRRFCIFSLVFSADGRQVIGGANDECLYIYDIELKKSIKISAHEDDINAVAFADSTSQILYSGSDDGLCKVWDRRVLNESKPKPVGILAGHKAGLTYVDPRGDGRHLITNSKDQTIKLWDMRVFSPYDRSSMSRIGPHWDYRCDRVPVESMGQKKLNCDTSLMTYKGHRVLRTLIRCHFSPAFTTGQRYIYTGCASGCILIYDILTGEIVKKLKGHDNCTRDVSWHPYNTEIISTSWDGNIVMWNYEEEVEDEIKVGNSEDDDPASKRRRSKRLQCKIRNCVANRTLLLPLGVSTFISTISFEDSSIFEFEEQCSEIRNQFANQWLWAEKCPFLKPASIKTNSSEVGAILPHHLKNNIPELDQLFTPKIVTKQDIIYTAGMDSIMDFNGAYAESEKHNDAPIINDTANVELDDDVWSLLLDLEAEERREATTDDSAYSSTNDISVKTNNNSSATYNTIFDSFMENVDDVIDIDELFNLPAELEILDDEIESTSTSSGFSQTVSISTADMLANVITQTGLFSTIQSCVNEIPSDTTLSFNEILDQGLSEKLSEQVVPVEIIEEETVSQSDLSEVSSEAVEVISNSRPSRKRKQHKDSSTKSSKISKTSDSNYTEPVVSTLSPKSTSSEEKYTMMRIKNNEASKKSRKLRKEKHHQMGGELVQLEEDNVRLKAEVERLENAVNQLKTVLTSTILKSNR